jgi:hypothetical protein
MGVMMLDPLGEEGIIRGRQLDADRRKNQLD